MMSSNVIDVRIFSWRAMPFDRENMVSEWLREISIHSQPVKERYKIQMMDSRQLWGNIVLFYRRTDNIDRWI